ncbi:signal transduction histidine kinase [Actinomadura pelletieri DSM 43383]|uniref:histidine kinase n=1 Tax=Actinomadura pelletieri DSM 43383 TaxID=1120940 RepID=A0A495QM63_9ACTN|nr:histidine kinase [Actinomadura pelletieri]RKS73521.1 signal transduction histidine kinase [Actinomadura pelletieri DSM 43383]
MKDPATTVHDLANACAPDPIDDPARPDGRAEVGRSAGADGPGARTALPARLRDASRAMRRAVHRSTRSALVKDLVLYVVVAFPVAAGLLPPTDPAPSSWAPQAAGLVALAAAIAVCRAWPTAALLTAVSLTAVHGNFLFAMPVLSYLTGRRTPRAQPPLWTFTTVLVGGAALATIRGLDVTAWFPFTIWLVLLGVMPWLVGRYWRQYQELLRAGWERAERLEHEQRITAERERLRERARIAQDMHDSLGHELALIAVRAGALQVAPGLDAPYRDAAAQLRAGAAEATEQLREIIGVLRDDTTPAGSTDPAAPVRPFRESIPDLVERAHASGVPVRLVTDPDSHAPPADLPPMVAIAAHRVVQEAVTNAAKHAPGAAVTVHLTHREHDPDGDGRGRGGGRGGGGTVGGGTVVVTVTNDPPPGGRPLLPSGGHGLTGLTERVRLLGGALHAGPTPAGGFTVTAHLPTVPPTTAPTSGTSPGSATVPASGPATGPAAGEWASESARHLADERRRVRRGLITAIAVPTGLMSVIGAIMVGYYIYVTLNSVLPPADYAALRLGTAQATVQTTLPPMQAMGTRELRERVPEPAGAVCRYYRPDANLLGINHYYRLCFTDGRLTSKNSYDTAQLNARQPVHGSTVDDSDRKDDE